jgi:CMP-N-acetylneuraminic acid synthetase
MRPLELAQDETSGIDPVLHALEQLPQYDAVLLLQPTSPLRTTEDIDACIELAQNVHAFSVVSVSAPEKHPYWMYRLGSDHRLQPLIDISPITRRQELPPVYALNGALYFARADWLRRHRAFVTAETVAYVMPPERSVDLDTLLDWKLAELLLQEHS